MVHSKHPGYLDNFVIQHTVYMVFRDIPAQQEQVLDEAHVLIQDYRKSQPGWVQIQQIRDGTAWGSPEPRCDLGPWKRSPGPMSPSTLQEGS